MVKPGGPCQGPGATEGTNCGVTEISDKSDWRKGGKFKPEHKGKACCTKNACRIFLGVIADPKIAKAESALVALMKDFLLERVVNATLPSDRLQQQYRREDMWQQYFKPFQLRQVPDSEGWGGPETATLRQSRVARLIRTYQRRIRNRVDHHRQNRVKNTLFFTVDPTQFYKRLAVGV